MRLGFTGTRKVPDDRVKDVYTFLNEEVRPGDEFCTGMCVGFDALVVKWQLINHNSAFHKVIVPANRNQVDSEVLNLLAAPSHGWHTVEFMPKNTDYRQRNARILDHAEKLIAVAEYPEHHAKSARSGTWMTVRIARLRGIPIVTYILNSE